jgi:hypothetical protein
MHEIDHDPSEPKIDRDPFPWWIGWVLVASGWVWYLYFKEFDWISIALGGFTVGLLACWAIEKTGNRIPDSWRNKL